jgi:hypothetical protein
MGAPIYSTPIVANGTMYIGTQTHLYAIGEGAKPVPPGSTAPAPAAAGKKTAAKK